MAKILPATLSGKLLIAIYLLWKFDHTQPDFFRDIDNNNLAVTSPDGVNLVLEQASDSGNEM